MPLNKIPFGHIYHLTNALHRHMASFGYQSADIPIIDSADLFLIRAGDQVINQLFTFERYGQQLALRPEFTAAAAHYYADQSLSTVERWQFYGPIFADNPAEFGHDYQRLSMGAELIGLAESVADAEIIGMAAQGLQKQGVTDWQLVIGHIGLMRRLLAGFRLDSRTERYLINHIAAIKNDKKQVLDHFEQAAPPAPYDQTDHAIESTARTLTESNTQQTLDAVLDATQRGMTMGGRTRHDIAQRLLQKRQRFMDKSQIIAAIDFLAHWGEWESTPSAAFAEIQNMVSESEQTLLNEWRRTLALVETYGIDQNHILLRPDLARNWDYYTGIVFEIQTHDGRHLGGGGRYDELVSLVGSGQTVPAVGFSYDLDNILAIMPDADDPSLPHIHIVLEKNNSQIATELALRLREHSLTAALLPPGEPNAAEIQVHVAADGTIRLNDASYNIQQIEQLITALVQASND